MMVIIDDGDLMMTMMSDGYDVPFGDAEGA